MPGRIDEKFSVYCVCGNRMDRMDDLGNFFLLKNDKYIINIIDIIEPHQLYCIN